MQYGWRRSIIAWSIDFCVFIYAHFDMTGHSIIMEPLFTVHAFLSLLWLVSLLHDHFKYMCIIKKWDGRTKWWYERNNKSIDSSYSDFRVQTFKFHISCCVCCVFLFKNQLLKLERNKTKVHVSLRRFISPHNKSIQKVL